MKNKKYFSKGFSLTELMITLFFISMIMSFVVSFSSYSRKKINFLRKTTPYENKKYTVLYFIDRYINNINIYGSNEYSDQFLNFYFFNVSSNEINQKYAQLSASNSNFYITIISNQESDSVFAEKNPIEYQRIIENIEVSFFIKSNIIITNNEISEEDSTDIFKSQISNTNVIKLLCFIIMSESTNEKVTNEILRIK